MKRFSLAFALALAGCTFQIEGAPVTDNPQADLAGLDLTGVIFDLTTVVPPDLAVTPIVPSHVPSGSLDPKAKDLSGVTGIDTGTLQIQFDGGNFAAPPAGVGFVTSKGVAILSVGKWTVDRDVAVRGALPLAVIAAGAVDVQQVIHVEANLEAPGPGGSDSGMGQGKGGSGAHKPANDDGGGGGAAFGGAGAKGGDGDMASGGAAGVPYGGKLSDFLGGSGGGLGSGGDSCSNNLGKGGGGGGALQISSSVSISVAATGGVYAGGGGGRGGCAATGGGGGGSGGDIFFESPSLTIAGTLAANGGGGGGGGSGGDGKDGEDGQFALASAAGGASGGTFGAGGGTGATRDAMPVTPGTKTNGGGGGGGVGRIWLRTGKMAPSTNGSTITPSPMSDATL